MRHPHGASEPRRRDSGSPCVSQGARRSRSPSRAPGVKRPSASACGSR
jgi:hypothetical protein